MQTTILLRSRAEGLGKLGPTNVNTVCQAGWDIYTEGKRYNTRTLALEFYITNMAAPLRSILQVIGLRSSLHIRAQSKCVLNKIPVRMYSGSFKKPMSALKLTLLSAGVGAAASAGYTFYNERQQKNDAIQTYVPEESDVADIINHPVSRIVTGVLNPGDLKLTLYQFQSCPYCCKVRAVLDYYGFSYDVVEVNSLTKKQIKFSKYKKVPILVIEGKSGDKKFTLQFKDSSLIASVLASYMYDPSTPLPDLHSFFPAYSEKKGRKTVWDFPNKYFIMYGENVFDARSPQDRKEERQWRRWVDDILMHTISPNVYRTASESLEAFHHFSDWGEWDKNFSAVTRWFIVYVGSLAMYFVGRIVKKRHNIKDDPRESLYDACDAWMKAVGKSDFLGVSRPNLADLSVYGGLHSFEGTQSFHDLMAARPNVQAWYRRMEQQLEQHCGAKIFLEKPFKH